MERIKDTFRKFKSNMKENSLDCLLSNIVVISLCGGCDIRDRPGSGILVWLRRVFGLWIILYVYMVGGLVYNATLAVGLEEKMQGLCCVCTGVFLFNKLCFFTWKRNTVKDVVRQIRLNDSLITKRDRESRLKTPMKILKKHVLVYSSLLILCVISRMFKPLYSDQSFPDKFSISVCPGLERTDVSPIKEVCLIILELELFSSVFTAMTYESTFMIFVEHTAALIVLLAEDFENLLPDLNQANKEILELNKFIKNDKDTNWNDEMEEDMKRTITKTLTRQKISSLTYRHANIIKTIQTLQNAYSLALGFDLCIGIVVLSIAIILYPVAADALADLVLLILLESFMYCFLGQQLSDAAIKLEAAVYSCGWENLDVSAQKSVFINLVQAQKPVALLAANIIPLEKETFGAILTNVYKIGATFRS